MKLHPACEELVDDIERDLAKGKLPDSQATFGETGIIYHNRWEGIRRQEEQEQIRLRQQEE